VARGMGNSLTRIKRMTAWTDELGWAAVHFEIAHSVEQYREPAVQAALGEWLKEVELPE
jgi:hypothetical protein